MGWVLLDASMRAQLQTHPSLSEETVGTFAPPNLQGVL